MHGKLVFRLLAWQQIVMQPVVRGALAAYEPACWQE